MKQLAIALGIVTILASACNDPAPTGDQKQVEDSTNVKESITPGIKHNEDPHPDLKANADSMSYTYPRVSKNGFYLMNRASNSPVNVLPIEPYEKLFSSLGTCSAGDSKYMAIDRRKAAVVENIGITSKGDDLVLDLQEPTAESLAFLERFKNESIAFIVNEHVIFMGKADQVIDAKEIVLQCASSDKKVIQNMIDNPIKEREVN